jgi:hypothetical protein
VGMFKDMFKLTREAQQLKKNTPTPSMGEMVSQMSDQLAELNKQQAGQSEILAEGIPGKAIIVSMGTPERGAAWFNLQLDLEVHPSTRDPYRVAIETLVPQAANLVPGAELPVRIDPDDPAKIAVDWGNAPQGPQLGQIRPV